MKTKWVAEREKNPVTCITIETKTRLFYLPLDGASCSADATGGCVEGRLD